MCGMSPGLRERKRRAAVLKSRSPSSICSARRGFAKSSMEIAPPGGVALIGAAATSVPKRASSCPTSSTSSATMQARQSPSILEALSVPSVRWFPSLTCHRTKTPKIVRAERQIRLQRTHRSPRRLQALADAAALSPRCSQRRCPRRARSSHRRHSTHHASPALEEWHRNPKLPIADTFQQALDATPTTTDAYGRCLFENNDT